MPTMLGLELYKRYLTKEIQGLDGRCTEIKNGLTELGKDLKQTESERDQYSDILYSINHLQNALKDLPIDQGTDDDGC